MLALCIFCIFLCVSARRSVSGLLLSSWSEGDGHEEGRSKHSLRSWGWVILLLLWVLVHFSSEGFSRKVCSWVVYG